jgi:molecular chaperone IbpA
MRTNLDLSPLHRSSIGFDRIFDLLENASRPQAVDSWPPYDIVRTGEDSYRITMAVAGFAEGDLDVTVEPNLLIVNGERKDDEGAEYLHHGLAARRFTRRFELADHVKVEGASLADGMLTVELKREVPEAMKPRKIAIATGDDASPRAGRIETKKQAA